MAERYSGKENSLWRGWISKEIPVCCIVLISVNVLIFLLELLVPALGSRLEKEGCIGAIYLIYDREWYRLVTSAFLHADAEHLANNMILLYFAGDIVERSLGRVRFCILYLTAAVCGNLLSAAYEMSTGGFYDSIGASGAVFGMTGALLFLVILKRGKAAEITIQRMLIAVALSFYAGFTNPSVNNAAHLGGLVTGFILAFVLGIIPQKKDEIRRF